MNQRQWQNQNRRRMVPPPQPQTIAALLAFPDGRLEVHVNAPPDQRARALAQTAQIFLIEANKLLAEEPSDEQEFYNIALPDGRLL